MTNTMRHKAATFLIIGVLVSLFLTSFNEIKDAHEFVDTTESSLKEGKNIFEMLNDLNLIKGINRLIEGMYNIASPDNILDILGALAQTGVGIVQVLAGIIEFPIRIFVIIGKYYYIPPVVSGFVGALVTLYIGFVILSTITRGDL